MTKLEVDYKLSPFRLVSRARRERKLTARKQWPREILWAGLGARESRDCRLSQGVWVMRCSHKAKIWFAYVRPECWQRVVSIRNRCDVLQKFFGTGAHRSIEIALVKPWCSCDSAKRVWKDLKELSHCWHILKRLAWSFEIRRLHSVPGQSLPSLTILVPLWFIVTSLVFFYLGKLLFSGFLWFEDFVLGQKTDKIQRPNFFNICFAKSFASKPTESMLVISPLNSIVQVGEYELTELALHFCRLFERLYWTFTKDLTFTLNFPLLSSNIFFWTKRKRDFV